MTDEPPTRQVRYLGEPGAVKIRLLEAADAAEYVDLLNQLDRETSFLLWEPGERTIEAAELRNHLTSTDTTDRLRLVATSEGRLVGFLVGHRGLVHRTRHRADFAMAVLGRFRRRSIGTRLLHEFESWAADNGIDRLELTVMAGNLGARSLYEQHGYKLEGTKHGAIRVDGESIDECIMGKVLTRT